MALRSKSWMVVAVLFTLVNVVGGVWAAWLGEQVHAGVHVALTLLGVYWVRWLNAGGSQRDEGKLMRETHRLEELEQSIDSVALQVERIGEAQRFADKLHAERVGVGQVRDAK